MIDFTIGKVELPNLTPPPPIKIEKKKGKKKKKKNNNREYLQPVIDPEYQECTTC